MQLSPRELEICTELGIDGSRLRALRLALDSREGRQLEERFTSRITAALLIGFRQGLAYERAKTTKRD